MNAHNGDLPTAAEPFRFYDELHLNELTGLRATNLHEFLQVLKIVPESCIYFHTHQFLQLCQDIAPVSANDFAGWVGDVLGDCELGERLSAIDTIQFTSIDALRQTIIAIIDDHLVNRPTAKIRFAEDARVFYFIKSVTFTFPTKYAASNLREFMEALREVSCQSIYFHIFEARLRLGKETNDFSNWLATSLGENELADRISRLDPYAYTIDDLRRTILGILLWKLV